MSNTKLLLLAVSAILALSACFICIDDSDAAALELEDVHYTESDGKAGFMIVFNQTMNDRFTAIAYDSQQDVVGEGAGYFQGTDSLFLVTGPLEDGIYTVVVDVVTKGVFQETVTTVTTYDVTIDHSSGGTVDVGKVQVNAGASISSSGSVLTIGTYTVKATAYSGYQFSSWSGIPSDGKVNSDITVTAKFTVSSGGGGGGGGGGSVTTYKVSVETDGNGTAKATPSSATSGTIITLTATPNEGYLFKAWQSSSGITITNDRFTMPARGVTVKAIFEKAGSIDVSLDRTSATMDVGDKLTLVATVTPSTTPDKTVTWSSSDSSVVTVSNGVVTAVGPGTAKVTVTTNIGGKTATCVVTVILPDVVIEADEGQIADTEISKIVDEVLPGQNVILDTTGSDSLVVDADSVLAILDKDAVVTVKADTGSVLLTKGSLTDIPEGAEMVITLADTSVPSGFAGKVPEGSVVLDVTVTVGDMIVTTFGEPITVSLPCGDFDDPSKLKVYHLADDGKMTDMDAVYDPVTNCMVFQTGHLSVYAIVEASEEPIPSEGGDSTMMYVAIVIVVLVVVILAAVFLARRRH